MIDKFISLLYYLFIYPYYKSRFKYIGFKVRITSPLRIKGFSNIYIGKSVGIQYNTWIEAQPLTGNKNCLLKIDDNTLIGNFNHIYATSKIHIGKNVLTADKVYISDNLHNYDDISMPIKNQSIKQLNEVYIGDESWLGENVCIIGASVGKHCIIGANSVVTKNIPDYCVAVGSPAYIIKKYNPTSQQWEKTDKQGNFIINNK